MSKYALRIPDSLFESARELAETDGVSMNQFFVMAIAEKVSALKTAQFFKERAQQAPDIETYRQILSKVKDAPPLPGDELPT
jgi:hypothetical protein